MSDGSRTRSAARTDLDALRAERDALRAQTDELCAQRDAALQRVAVLEEDRAATAALTARLTAVVRSPDADALWRQVADVVTASLGPDHRLCGLHSEEGEPPGGWSGAGCTLGRSACAALRTGVPRLPGDGGCEHPRPAHSACAPIVAQGEPVAVVCLDLDRAMPGALESMVARVRRLSVAVEVVLLRLSLERAARIDPLTGLLNRGAFEIAAARIHARAARTREPWSAIVFDLDRFKRVNDTGGHAEGDRVLVRVAEEARAVVRESDVLGRIGGEEFALVLEGCDLKAATVRAEALRVAIGAGVVSTAGSVTASLGVAEASPDAPDLWSVVKLADAAMYAAKAAGRDQVRQSAASPGA